MSLSYFVDIATVVDLEELPNTHFVGWGNDTDDVKGRQLFYVLSSITVIVTTLFINS